MSAQDGATREQVIESYFQEGLTYKEILHCLASSHAIVISLRMLKQIVKRLKLRRRIPLTEHLAVAAVQGIQKQLGESGQCIGYKAMHRRLQKQGILVGRNNIRFMLKEVDAQGVADQARRRLKRR